jgi:hypothetical protein
MSSVSVLICIALADEVLPAAVGRGSAPVGLDPARRAGRARVHRVVPVADRGDPCSSAAPALRALSGLKGRDSSIITHPPGEETHGDWIELPNPPSSWGLGREAHLLVGSLAHSGRWLAVLADCEDFPHLIEALDRVVRKLGGLTRRWRFDRMATVCSPTTGTVSAAFAAAAKHYAVGVDLCPPRHGNRKGVVEKANHSAAQRWWRTVADDATVTTAQQNLDALCERLDQRIRRRDGRRVTVAVRAHLGYLKLNDAAEHLAPCSTPPATTACR